MNETPGGLVIRVERGAPPHRGVAHDVCAAHVTYLKVLRGPEKEVRVVEAHLVGGEVLTFSGPAAQAFLWAWERRMGVYWASWYPGTCGTDAGGSDRRKRRSRTCRSSD